MKQNILLGLSIAFTLICIMLLAGGFFVSQLFPLLKGMNQETCSIRINIKDSPTKNSDVNIIYTGKGSIDFCNKVYPKQSKYLEPYAPAITVILESKPKENNPKMCEALVPSNKNITITVTSNNKEYGESFCTGLKDNLTK